MGRSLKEVPPRSVSAPSWVSQGPQRPERILTKLLFSLCEDSLRGIQSDPGVRWALKSA